MLVSILSINMRQLNLQ